MATLSTLISIGAIVGTPLYSHVLFDGTAQGWRKMLPTLVSASLALVCLALAVTAARASARGLATCADRADDDEALPFIPECSDSEDPPE